MSAWRESVLATDAKKAGSASEDTHEDTFIITIIIIIIIFFDTPGSIDPRG